MFYISTNLQGSQTQFCSCLREIPVLHIYKLTRFSNHFNAISTACVVLHIYKLTRFSNPLAVYRFDGMVLHIYKLTRFSNQMGHITYISIVLHIYKLTRFSNLKFISEILAEPVHFGKCCKFVYKTIPLLYTYPYQLLPFFHKHHLKYIYTL